ncbi:MAG TPA: hypothetical protein VMZ06_03210 [Candidatus Bathyarchaeia archaeon]|nr:hypothetical protein [Candidatus Bathyarchaeia archaeon]
MTQIERRIYLTVTGLLIAATVLVVFHLATAMAIRYRMRRRNVEGARKPSPYHVIYAAIVWCLVVYSLHAYLGLFASQNVR